MMSLPATPVSTVSFFLNLFGIYSVTVVMNLWAESFGSASEFSQGVKNPYTY